MCICLGQKHHDGSIKKRSHMGLFHQKPSGSGSLCTVPVCTHHLYVFKWEGGSQAHQQQEAADRLVCTPLIQQNGTERGDKRTRESLRGGGGTRQSGRGFAECTRAEGKRGYGEKEATKRESANSNSSLSLSETTTPLNFLRRWSVTR